MTVSEREGTLASSDETGAGGSGKRLVSIPNRALPGDTVIVESAVSGTEPRVGLRDRPPAVRADLR